MTRHFVPAVGGMLAILSALTCSAGRAEAQTGVGAPGAALFNDPFAFYYAIYLPNQQLQSLRPTPLDSVNDAMVSRQYYTQANRRSLYDPISPYAETYDPLRPYSNQQERLARPARFRRGPANAAHAGPTLYFNRIAQYYPDMANRSARNANGNTGGRRAGAAGRTGGGGGMGGGGMGGGMGGGGMGMPGMGMF